MDTNESKLYKELGLDELIDMCFVFYVDKETNQPREYETENTIRLVWINGEVFEYDKLIKE